MPSHLFTRGLFSTLLLVSYDMICMNPTSKHLHVSCDKNCSYEILRRTASYSKRLNHHALVDSSIEKCQMSSVVHTAVWRVCSARKKVDEKSSRRNRYISLSRRPGEEELMWINCPQIDRRSPVVRSASISRYYSCFCCRLPFGGWKFLDLQVAGCPMWFTLFYMMWELWRLYIHTSTRYIRMYVLVYII